MRCSPGRRGWNRDPKPWACLMEADVKADEDAGMDADGHGVAAAVIGQGDCFRPLNDDERERFLKYGPGSDSACRWLSAVLFSLCNYDEAPHSAVGLRVLDMHDRHDRELVLDHGFMLLLSRIMAYEAWDSGWHSRVMAGEGSVRSMEPMTAWSADTLIRFSMDRHDATDMLCSDRIGNPVGAMMDAMEVDNLALCMIPYSPINMYMIRHMALPIATHPFSPLQTIVDAVCYGHHGNGMMDASGVGCTNPGDGSRMMMAPLSGSMEYSGPDCDPRLMAMVLGKEGFSLLADAWNVKTMALTVPGVEDMGLKRAVGKTVSLFSRLEDSPFNPIASPATARRLPLTTYEIMGEAVQNGRYEETASCLDVRNHIPRLENSLCVNAMQKLAALDGLPSDGNDPLPDTYAMMQGRLKLRKTTLYPAYEAYTDNWHGCAYGTIPDMADIAWALTLPRPATTDTTILHNLMASLPRQGQEPPTGEPAAITGAGAWNWFAASLPLRDPILADATLTLTKTMIDFADKLISTSKHLPDKTIGIMLIPDNALDMLLDDYRNGMPYDFALQTLFSRSYIGADKPRNPDFHGLAMTMPYDISDSHDSDTINITITPAVEPAAMPGTTDLEGRTYPDVTMIP